MVAPSRISSCGKINARILEQRTHRQPRQLSGSVHNYYVSCVPTLGELWKAILWHSLADPEVKGYIRSGPKAKHHRGSTSRSPNYSFYCVLLHAQYGDMGERYCVTVSRILASDGVEGLHSKRPQSQTPNGDPRAIHQVTTSTACYCVPSVKLSRSDIVTLSRGS